MSVSECESSSVEATAAEEVSVAKACAKELVIAGHDSSTVAASVADVSVEMATAVDELREFERDVKHCDSVRGE